jgi:large conductance mechanosensitive channel protein
MIESIVKSYLRRFELNKQLKNFMDFVREQGVVGLAVGLAVGTAAGATVKAIVDGLINPIVGFILGGDSLGQKTWNTGLSNGGNDLVFQWGAVLSSIITLVAVAAVIYYVIHGLKLDKLDRKKEIKEEVKKEVAKAKK